MSNKSCLTVSEFFDMEMSSLVLGAFFSRYVYSEDKKYIFAVVSSKKSTKIEIQDVNYESYTKEYLEILNVESYPNSFWKLGEELLSFKLPKGQIFYVLENDSNISEDSFFNKMYKKLLSCNWIYDEELNEEKKKFIRGFMELRGSVDLTANYIAQDYFYNSTFELKRTRLLIDYLSVPYYVTNINFRELQEQFYSDFNKRNTQLRLNINWYMKNIGMMNKYKAMLFKESRKLSEFDYSVIKNIYYFDDNKVKYRGTNILDERLNYYFTNVLGKDINSNDIKKMRSNLGFDGPLKSFRNKALVELIRLYTPDECACCKNRYKIEDRTHINKTTGKYSFEIHHVISLGENKELDDENNLVKLCPACHAALKRSACPETEQKGMIQEILQNEPKTLDFAKHVFDTEEETKIVNYIFESLK